MTDDSPHPVPPADSPPDARPAAHPLTPMERFEHFLAGFLQLCGCVFLLLLAAGLAAWMGFEWWAGHASIANPPAPEVVFLVHKGDSLRGVVARLERARLLRPAFLVYGLALREGLDRNLQPGEYRITPGSSPRTVLRLMSRVKADAKAERVVLPEGWTLEQFADRLAARKIIAGRDRFLKLCEDPAVAREAGIPAERAQGFLFPDTYDFVPPADERDVIFRLAARHREVVESLKLLPGINTPGAYPLTYAETIVLASIIEREGRDPKEMPMISSVFHNRLRQGMRLESCATVRFALSKWEAALTMEDLRTNSPINTYMQKGLPPDPICNPGKAAINAAFRPEKSDYLFFVYKGDGHHFFSRTGKEHESARETYKSSWSQAKSRAKEEK